MGAQFWWFYDTIAAAVVMLCIFLAGRKGIFKALIAMMCLLVGLVISMSVSASMSGSIQKNLVRPSNVKNLTTALSEFEFNEQVERYLDEKYDVLLDFRKIEDIYTKGENIEGKLYQYLNAYTSRRVDSPERFSNDLREGYAQIISKAVGKYLNKYSAETAAKAIRESNSEDIDKLVSLLQDSELRTRAAEFIADHYTAAPYKDIVRMVCFLVLFALSVFITLIIVRSLTRNMGEFISPAQHFTGGLCGIGIGAVFVVAVAAIVRANVILGSNEMLFFNHDVINKTYVFRIAYDLISKTN